MRGVTLYEGDNRDHLRRLLDQGVRVHSVVTDPPYGLTSVTKRFGGKKAAPAKFGTDGAFARASGGFMGQKWDSTGIERDPEFWALIWEILLPGGYCLAFSSPRTGHWQACAMDMAGFVMHPFQGWLYGSGMPKAHNAAMAIDKHLKVAGSRGDPKTAAHAGWIDRGAMRGEEGHEGWQRPWMENADSIDAAARRYLPGSPEAQQWDGWAYGAQALKPALEPIYVGQKPFSEKNGALNLLLHGVGAINIDGCRVASREVWPPTGEQAGGVTVHDYGDGLNNSGRSPSHQLGRHPANLLHDGSAEVVAMFPQSAGQLASAGPANGPKTSVNVYGDYGPRSETPPRDDSGSAARFFNSFPETGQNMQFPTGEEFTYGTDVEQTESELQCDPIFYQAKATKADRAGSKHPTVKPVSLMQWLVCQVTPAGGTVLDPFAGSGTTAEAARREGANCILMEAEPQFAADIRRRFNLPIPTTESNFDDILGGATVEDFETLLG